MDDGAEIAAMMGALGTLVALIFTIVAMFSLKDVTLPGDTLCTAPVEV